VSIGFFTGTYYFGPFWIFDPANHRFVAYNHCMPKGGTAKYHMFSLNPYEYFADEDKSPEIVKQMESRLKSVTRGQFEKFLMLLDEEKFSHMFFVFHDLILNSTPLSPATRLTLYAGCVEMCAKCETNVMSTNHGKTSLYDKRIRKQISKLVTDILKREYGDHPDTRICIQKLNNIFQAPNQDTLAAAFECVGVKLDETDKDETLALRNVLLHGNDVIKSTFDEADSRDYINECERKCFAFHALIWRYIMKSICYEGEFVDVARINELFRETKANQGKPLSKRV